MTPDRHPYRSAAGLLAAVRNHHRLTQRQLADRSGVHQPQLARYEKGTAEPTLPVSRRILDSVGWAPTLGVEPTTAALDEAHGVADELGGPVLGHRCATAAPGLRKGRRGRRADRGGR